MNRQNISHGDRPQPLTKQVFDELHRQITTFELKPIQMLSEASVSDWPEALAQGCNAR